MNPLVPNVGQRAVILLGPKEEPVWCTVLGRLRRYNIDVKYYEHTIVQWLVEVQVHGEDKPRDVAAERFVLWSFDRKTRKQPRRRVLAKKRAVGAW